MFRTALRKSSRTLTATSSTLSAAPRRFASSRLSVPPADRYRSWKSTLARWGLAAGGVWYYTTSDVFADSPAYNTARLPTTDIEDENLQTVDSISASRKTRRSAPIASASTTPSSDVSVPSLSTSPTSTQSIAAAEATPLEAGGAETLEELDEEADQQGAYNEETGEINWDCPCLGGMAHGPCGPEFREAFSCFIYSKEEPKGIDCIDKFKGMQDCFRAHPDIYGAELSDDEDEVEAQLAAEQDQPQLSATAAVSATPSDSSSSSPQDSTTTSSQQSPTAPTNTNAPTPPSSFQSDPAKHPHAPMPVAMHHDPSHGNLVPSAAYSATTDATSIGAPPGATRGEDEEKKTERAKKAAEQVRKDHGGKEADRVARGGEHRSESELVTGGEKGSKLRDSKSR